MKTGRLILTDQPAGKLLKFMSPALRRAFFTVILQGVNKRFNPGSHDDPWFYL
jgi:hypothetical protein